jgi:cytochrome c-type biogenesis protein CcmH
VQQASTRVASVPSLIDGLESRLASEPDNASGWALLAQSYAFVGNTDGANEAMRRAVDLGLDEADLRQRVQSARRDAHAGLQAGLTR